MASFALSLAGQDCHFGQRSGGWHALSNEGRGVAGSTSGESDAEGKDFATHHAHRYALGVPPGRGQSNCPSLLCRMRVAPMILRRGLRHFFNLFTGGPGSRTLESEGRESV